jgi:hypothetical protein
LIPEPNIEHDSAMGSVLADARPEALVDRVEPRFRDGLECLLESLGSQAGLTGPGLRAAYRSLAALVTTQRQAAESLRSAPGVAAAPVARPIFVTGLHRSGTTLLHRLLARHPALRAPALWEQLAPADPADATVLARRAQTYVEEYYRVAPALPAIHFLDAYLPDECHRLLSVTFRSEIFEVRYRVPDYGQWLRDRDFTAAYRYHRTLLRCLLRREPGPRLVLKCPFHLRHLDAVAAVYPDAVVVRLHRDPAETIPSACRLTETIRCARSDRVDPREIGRFWLSLTASSLAARTPPGLAVLDVRYPDLLRDPVAVLARVCEFAGVPSTGDARRTMTAYLAEHPAGSHGANRYRAGDFGLSPDDLHHRFAAYRHNQGL